MLRLASRPAHHSPWLPPVAFINSDRGDPSHTTTTGSWIGVDLEVRPPVAFINSDRGNPSHATTTGIWIGVDLEVISQWLSLIAIKENLLSRHHHWNLGVDVDVART